MQITETKSKYLNSVRDILMMETVAYMDTMVEFAYACPSKESFVAK